MNLKIIPNPDKEKRMEVAKAVKDNDGYCPCELQRTPYTKCKCKNFREQDYEGECHCGLFVKVIDNEES